MFIIYNIINATMNVLYATTLCYYGNRLRNKILRFANPNSTISNDYTLLTNNNNNNNISKNNNNNNNINNNINEILLISKMKITIRRLLCMMIICLFCFLLRTIMLIITIPSVHESIASYEVLPKYGDFLFF
jgi:hypothetical protein